MKKTVKLLAMFILVFSLCGCKKENPEFIEINAYELVDLYDNQEKMILAIVNDNDKNKDAMLETLDRYQKNTKNWVYYIDTTNVERLETEYINTLFSEEADECRIYVLQNGEVIGNLSGSTSLQELRQTTGNTKYGKVNLDKQLQTREYYYQEAFDSLSNGKIGTAYAQFYMSLPKEESKMALKDEKIFDLLHAWEYLEIGDKCTYLSLKFYKGDEVFDRYYYNGKCKELTEEEMEYVTYDYYIEDYVIYAKKTTEEEYKPMYNIDQYSESHLVLTTSKKEYLLTRKN